MGQSEAAGMGRAAQGGGTIEKGVAGQGAGAGWTTPVQGEDAALGF